MKDSCQSCKFWKQRYQLYGDCDNENMEIKFIPYTQGPFGVPIDIFNKYERPKKKPLTAIDYSCIFYNMKDIEKKT